MFWKAIGRWALVAIAVPLAATVIRRISKAIEAKRGETRATRMLRSASSGLERLSGRRPTATAVPAKR